MYGGPVLRCIDATEREFASTWICGGGCEEDANGFCFNDALCEEVVRDGRYGGLGSRVARQADWTQAKEHAQMVRSEDSTNGYSPEDAIKACESF